MARSIPAIAFGNGSMVVVTVEVPVQPLASVTVTVKVPAVETSIVRLVSVVDQTYDTKSPASSVLVLP